MSVPVYYGLGLGPGRTFRRWVSPNPRVYSVVPHFFAQCLPVQVPRVVEVPFLATHSPRSSPGSFPSSVSSKKTSTRGPRSCGARWVVVRLTCQPRLSTSALVCAGRQVGGTWVDRWVDGGGGEVCVSDPGPSVSGSSPVPYRSHSPRDPSGDAVSCGLVSYLHCVHVRGVTSDSAVPGLSRPGDTWVCTRCPVGRSCYQGSCTQTQDRSQVPLPGHVGSVEIVWCVCPPFDSECVVDGLLGTRDLGVDVDPPHVSDEHFTLPPRSWVVLP